MRQQQQRRAPRRFWIMITLQQYIAQWIHAIITWLQSLWDQWTGEVLLLDSGVQVRVGRHPIAEGGFSMVYLATSIHSRNQVYALKRIRCDDEEMRQACHQEAEVHYAVQRQNSKHSRYTLPLLGMAMKQDDLFCYMLFPYLPHSLRQEVNHRVFTTTNPTSSTTTTNNQRHIPAPWNDESLVLQIFQRLCQGVACLHAANYSHRDIKLENILCQGSNNHHLQNPVLMDFGSAGPLTRPLTSRTDVMELVDDASCHTTISYRPPELFMGELRVDRDDYLDYTKVDVWMLGCTLFALLYGASPFECEFRHTNDDGTTLIKIVDCNQLRVLGNLPKPPKKSAAAKWYSQELVQLVEWILHKDRRQRPTLDQVQARVEALLWHPQQSVSSSPSSHHHHHPHHDVEDPMDLFVHSRNNNVL